MNSFPNFDSAIQTTNIINMDFCDLNCKCTFSHDNVWRLLLELLDERDSDGGGGGQDVAHVAEEGGGGGGAGDQETQERRSHVQEIGLKSSYLSAYSDDRN